MARNPVAFRADPLDARRARLSHRMSRAPLHLFILQEIRPTPIVMTTPRNCGRYRIRAQREAVAVSSHGRITGYFIGPDEHDELKRFNESRRSFATAELSEERVRAIAAAGMDSRHSSLDAILDPR
jgi:hypothetical protein